MTDTNSYLKDFLGIDYLPQIGDPLLYGKAILTIMGSDGEVSSEEMSCFMEHAKNMGFSGRILNELKGFDHLNNDLDKYVGAVANSSVANMLLYDAIMASSADGYAEEEREAVAIAANKMNVDKSALKAIEGVAGVEVALLKSGIEIESVKKAVREARISLIAPKVAPLNVDDVAQAKRFHTQRTGLVKKEDLPSEVIEGVKNFKVGMDNLAEKELSGEYDADRTRRQTMELCESFHKTFFESVKKYGSLGLSVTFNYLII